MPKWRLGNSNNAQHVQQHKNTVLKPLKVVYKRWHRLRRRARASEAVFLFLPSETVICNVNQSSILPEIIYFRKFLTTATFFLWVSMDFRVSITAITKYSSPSMALVNKETWALFGVVLELIYLKHVLVPRQGKGVCQIHMQAGTAAVGSRNAHCLEYIQISELNRPHWTHI